MFIEYGELSTLFYEITKPVGTELDGDITAYKEHLGATEGKILEAGVGTVSPPNPHPCLAFPAAPRLSLPS